MFTSSARRTTALVVTPATRFGSWAWLEKVILAAGDDVDWIVVSYGRPSYEIPNVTFRTLPALKDYPEIGRFLSHPLLLWLNAVYLLPLAPLAWWCAFRYRARVVLANGVVSAGLSAPLRLFGIRLLLAFHGTVGHSPRPIQALLRILLGACEAAFVNSNGGAEDLAHVYDPERIELVRLWADERFFEVPLERPRGDRLSVLFVGRQDPEKFAQCLRVCKTLAGAGVVELRAVGAGPLAAAVDGPGLDQLGYIADVDRLAQVFGAADVVWAPADVTYLSIPGVEGLAAGCPVIVSNLPGVEVKANDGVRIPRDLVVPPIGRVVDGSDDDEALAVLRSWHETGIDQDTRRACRKHAREFHSDANLVVVVDAVRGSAGRSKPTHA